jgi:hypothetical protein
VARCQKLIQLDKKCVALLHGQGQPKDVAEQMQMAQLCHMKKDNMAAVRFYRGVLNGNPALATNLAKGWRYQAAVAAILAGLGQGKDAAQLPETERSALRRQALAWLQADLKLLRQQLLPAASPEGTGSFLNKLATQSRGNPAALAWGIDKLSRWQTDPALASIRDAQALTGLPAAEQQSWWEFWGEVAQVLQKARAQFAEAQIHGTLTVRQRRQVHEVKLTAGTICVLDMQSKQLDAFLWLEDATGKKLRENNDIQPGVVLDARIVFRASWDGTYRVVATSFEQRGLGAYTLRIRKLVGAK